MKITKLKTFLVPPRWLFLKIETDEGLCGWGEPVLEGRAQTVAAAVDELADYLIGKDPSPVEDHWNVLYRGGFYRGGGVHMSALAGIDQALWDLRGKALGQPVHRLLGGPVRESIRTYSWVGGDRPEDIAEGARDAAAHGFTALKMNGTEELQYIDSFAKIDRVAENVSAVREAVGKDFGIGVDFHGRVHRPMAKSLLRELEQYRLMFVEEPVHSENADVLQDIRRSSASRSLLGNDCTRVGTSSKFSSLAMLTSFSLMFPMRGVSPRRERSRRWRNAMTLLLLSIARLARLRWQLACNWMRSAITQPSRNSRWECTTTR